LRLLTNKRQVEVAVDYCFNTTASRIAARTLASKLSQPALRRARARRREIRVAARKRDATAPTTSLRGSPAAPV
ncbi:MAG: hypothetical protein M3018_00405, partial [Actinomycetota bacterium]|nr:hypothetical protein [Actinomycetota bacterium]